ncbi:MULTISPECIES: OmpA family protein [Zhongshania]|jgi:flagellar motor protein MotB|uniref:OmpA family protein n=1 Tax=Zhongshania aquimaris TaxID=2857107 RepID=A0ABS6VVW6_9GAMM|nr:MULTISPECIES: OmpA family protein [Spongiibacteraceae]MBQ0760138.1 OmpA family protein [Zhongshania sp.]MBW2942149.1 OmpA family protein [Zhongshania aquimaris]|tara:strand:- start:1628 stop:2275 length:648 start_codon:yes stop_codon:yes gene_type:complete
MSVSELDNGLDQEPPIWAIFGDLMTGLVGVFVLLLVWALGFQLELSQTLEKEIQKREVAEQRRLALEQALADPLAAGRVTLRDGKIGISGNVLFSLNSAELQDEGRELLHTLRAPLQVYLGDNEQLLMVSGFTDDLPIQKGNLHFRDNWELSAQRALTVTRALIEEGMPADMVFAAAFGAQQPVVENNDADSRSQNRRVEMAPVPRAQAAAEKAP